MSQEVRRGPAHAAGTGRSSHRSQSEAPEKARGLTGLAAGAGPWTPDGQQGLELCPGVGWASPLRTWKAVVLDVGQEDPGVVWALGEPPAGSAPQEIPGGWALAFRMSGPGVPTVPWLQGLRLGHGLQARTPASPGSLFWSILASQISAAEVTRLKPALNQAVPARKPSRLPHCPETEAVFSEGPVGHEPALSLPGGTSWTRASHPLWSAPRPLQAWPSC